MKLRVGVKESFKSQEEKEKEEDDVDYIGRIWKGIFKGFGR